MNSLSIMHQGMHNAVLVLGFSICGLARVTAAVLGKSFSSVHPVNMCLKSCLYP